MGKVIIVKPNLTKEENEANWLEVTKVLDEIAKEIVAREYSQNKEDK